MRLGIVTLIFVFFGLAGFSQAVSSEIEPVAIVTDQVWDLSPFAAWCSADPHVTVQEISQEGCQFRPVAPQNNLVHGLSQDAFWLRFSLNNPSDKLIVRWLRVGHPRLESVTLFSRTNGSAWDKSQTGLTVAAKDRPILAELPLLPVELAPHTTSTYYVRVHSDTAIDLTSELLSPRAYLLSSQFSRLILYMSLGAALLAFVFSFMIYAELREISLVFFAGSLLFTALYDAGYTGLTPAYLWPADVPFPIAIQLVIATLAVISLSAFVMSILPANSKPRFLKNALSALFIGLVCSTFLAFIIGYQNVIVYFGFLVLAIVFTLIILIVSARSDDGSKRLLLLLSLCPVLLLLMARLLMLFGIIPYYLIHSIGFSWALTILSPLIIRSVLQQARHEQAELSKLTMESQLRTRFLSHISHEFRSPLNLIINYASLVRSDSARVTTKEALDAIQQSGYELLSLIDSILDYLKGDQKEVGLSLTSLSLGRFIDEIKTELNRLARLSNNQSETIFTGATASIVRIDQMRLKQVLRNLLANANRYTHSGTVTFKCHAEEITPQICRLDFCVSDTGIGISQEDLRRIFDPYVRGKDAIKSAEQGFGIGLALSQRLVGMMGSRISVDSHLGTGSEFSFSIKCDLVHPEINLQSAWEDDARTVTLLLIDDDPSHLLFLQSVLASSRLTLLTALSGEDAERHWSASIDLVVTDQFMKHGDGWSVLRRSADYGIPVILVSATEAQRPSEMPDNLQFTSIFQKPLDPRALVQEINRLIKTRVPLGTSEEQAVDQTQSEPKHQLKPSEHQLTTLRKYVSEGAVSEIERWAAEGSAQSPEFASFYAAITVANLRLDFAELRRLADDNQ